MNILNGHILETLDFHQPMEQVGFRKNFTTIEPYSGCEPNH